MKWIKRSLLIIILLPLISFVLWYATNFLPHLNQLRIIIDKESSEISEISDIQKIARVAESPKGLRNYALRKNYRELVLKENYQTNLKWHLNTALWYLSSYIHFNDNEIFYLWSASIYIGKHGLQNSSSHLFSKKLSELTLRQKTQLIAMAKGPSIYKLGSKRLKKRMEIILDRL